MNQFRNKSIYLVINLLVLIILLSNNQFVSAANTNDGTVHALGNGRMCIFQRNADIVKTYTGSYSSPSILNIECVINPTDSISTKRDFGTAIWNYAYFRNNVQTTQLLDFVDSELPVFVRKISTKKELRFKVNVENYVQTIDNSKQLSPNGKFTGRLLTMPSGIPFYQTYISQRIIYTQILVSGNISIISSPNSKTMEIICTPGDSYIYIVGGPEFPQLMENNTKVTELNTDQLLIRTKKFWQNFTNKRKDFTQILPVNVPQRDKLLQTIDDVAVLLKAQQSIQGGVIAGYPYPMAYVRDQYGTSRGMLALGMYAEAKAILEFYWEIWKKYGFIHNAQAIGLDGVFHIHENDEVESPALLIYQAFDLFDKTHDVAFMKQISPMLNWAFNCQKKHLAGNMLPFNGDETYVAGGLLPRSSLNDGSAEATMLFVESGQKYVDWAAKNKALSRKSIQENNALIARVRKAFKDNFWHDDKLWTNNPKRTLAVELPAFRHGVCEKASENCMMRKYGGIVWTKKNENDRYQCAACSIDDCLPKVTPKEYNLLSAALLPFYMHVNIIPYEQLQQSVLEIKDAFVRKNNEISTNKSNQTNQNVTTVGYDYGFLLQALTKLNIDATFVFNQTLSVVDRDGAWSEYYINGSPAGTRCRPWESGINIESLINWAKIYKNVK